MPLVFAGVCSHGPGITGRAERADADVRDELYANFARLREAIGRVVQAGRGGGHANAAEAASPFLPGLVAKLVQT